MKTISDFAPAVRGKNFTGWRMIDGVVPHASTPFMTFPAAGSTREILPSTVAASHQALRTGTLRPEDRQQLCPSYNTTMRSIKPSIRSVPPYWLIPPKATCSLATKSKRTNRILEGNEKGSGEGVPRAKSLSSGSWSGRDESSWKCSHHPGKRCVGSHCQEGSQGSIVYTDRYKSYDALMFCGYRHLRVDHGKYLSRGRVYINGLEGFWS